jgi:GTPase
LPALSDGLHDLLPISAVTGEGIEHFLERVTDEVTKVRAERPPALGYVRHVVREDPLSVVREDDAWRVSGARVERAVAMTDFNNDEAVERLQKRLVGMGVERLLTSTGAVEGDDVRIGDTEFEFEPEDDT